MKALPEGGVSCSLQNAGKDDGIIVMRLDTRKPCAYEFVKSVESVAAFEGAKRLPAINVPTPRGIRDLRNRD
jgi:hypothetical protein